MENGGRSVGTFIRNNFNSTDLLKLNNSLINLLTNGIIPMNNKQIYHNDLKGSNVLVKKNGDQIVTRIIDWGLSFMHNNLNVIPDDASKPFQFNSPFSSVLFKDEFKQSYDKFFQETQDLNYFKIQQFVVKYLNTLVKTGSKGHLKYIKIIAKEFNYLKSNVLNKGQLVSSNDYIVNYLSTILNKYTNIFKSDLVKNKTINVSEYILRRYFNEVYTKNLDVWGFVSIYLDFFDVIYNNKKLLRQNAKLLNKIKQIMVNHLYLNSTRLINVTKLIDDLKILNMYIRQIKSVSKRMIAGNNISHKLKTLHYSTQTKKHNMRTKLNKNKKTRKYKT